MLDKIFGELEYEYGWNGSVELDWFGEKKDIDLMISGEPDDALTQWQYDSYEQFLGSWAAISETLKEKIYEYYCQLRDELGYDDDSNDDYPPLSQADDILGHIELDAIVIPEEGIFEERCVSLALRCTWDEENGVGVRLLNESIDEIGYQDVAF